MESKSSINTSDFKPLTGLRYVAALMVFIHHLAPRNFNPLITNFIVELQAGVPIFFVLSGFLICHRYFSVSQEDKYWYKKYFINRFARIYPMYFIITIANCVFFSVSPVVFLLNISMLIGFFNEYVFNPLPQNWSLTVEITFYLFAPLIFYLIRKKISLVFQFTLFLFIGVLLTSTFGKLNFHGFFAEYDFTFILTFFGRCFEFLSGVYLAYWLNKKSNRLPQKINSTYVGAFLILTTIISISLVGGLNSFSGILLHNIILPANVCLLIYAFITENSLLSNFLSGRPMQLLGKSSYTFFLLHVGFLHTFFFQNIISNLFLELLFTTSISIALFILIEEPLHNKTKKSLRALFKIK